MFTKLSRKAVAVLLVIAMVFATMPSVALAAPKQPPASQSQNSKVPPIDPELQAKAEKLASIVAQVLTLNKDKSVSLNLKKIGKLNSEQRAIVERMVSDLNAGKIGIAVVTEDGQTILYGNAKALPSDQHHDSNSVNANWWGIHIYLDSYWTGQLHDFNGWAIGAIAGLILWALCATGVGCVSVAVGVLVSFILFVIWQVIRPYMPTTMAFHLPWWGHAYVQLWKSGAWYNGYWFWTYLWT